MFDRKYKIENNKLVKRSTGVPIPDDEPCFVFLGRDKYALSLLLAYSMILSNLEQREAVMESIKDFRQFQEDNPDKIKEPTP